MPPQPYRSGKTVQVGDVPVSASDGTWQLATSDADVVFGERAFTDAGDAERTVAFGVR